MENKKLNRLRVVMAEKELSNMWLSENLGVSQATVSKWVTNFSQPSLEMLIKISKLLEVDVNDLIRIHVDKQGHKRIAWGRSMICLYDKRAKQERMVRLRFAVGFAKKVYHGKAIVNVLNLVSNLAEFSVVYDPKSGKFSISR